eukprot:6207426-Pleurochrysis_carterae.AAC.2
MDFDRMLDMKFGGKYWSSFGHTEKVMIRARSEPMAQSQTAEQIGYESEERVNQTRKIVLKSSAHLK